MFFTSYFKHLLGIFYAKMVTTFPTFPLLARSHIHAEPILNLGKRNSFIAFHGANWAGSSLMAKLGSKKLLSSQRGFQKRKHKCVFSLFIYIYIICILILGLLFWADGQLFATTFAIIWNIYCMLLHPTKYIVSTS